MNSKFLDLIEETSPSFEQLMNMRPVRNGFFDEFTPKRGVYLFSERDNGHLYVGRSNNIRTRYGGHCNPGATRHSASFAFRLARETTGKVKPSYERGPYSRESLMKDDEFLAAFNEAKARIRLMDFRFVEENHPIKQCILQIYTAIALETPYNNFDTH